MYGPRTFQRILQERWSILNKLTPDKNMKGAAEAAPYLISKASYHYGHLVCPCGHPAYHLCDRLCGRGHDHGHSGRADRGCCASGGQNY